MSVDSDRRPRFSFCYWRSLVLSISIELAFDLLYSPNSLNIFRPVGFGESASPSHSHSHSIRLLAMMKVYPKATTVSFGSDGAKMEPGCGGGEAAVLTVWKKSLLFNCSGFTVFDGKGNLVFRVDNYVAGDKGEVVLMDASGKPLLTIRRKVVMEVVMLFRVLVHDLIAILILIINDVCDCRG